MFEISAVLQLFKSGLVSVRSQTRNRGIFDSIKDDMYDACGVNDNPSHSKAPDRVR